MCRKFSRGGPSPPAQLGPTHFDGKFIMGNPGAALPSTLRSCKGWSLGESEHTDHSLLPCGMLEPLGCTLSFCENTRELFVEENQYQLHFSIVSTLEHATMEQEVPGLVTRPLR